MTITVPNIKFTSSLKKRSKTDAIILHHAAVEGDISGLHNAHLRLGWAGIGYNFYIRLDGMIQQGRGWEYVGAHAGSGNDYNARSIGICFEGDYTKRQTMPTAQYNSGVELIREALKRYGDIRILGHQDVTATACPGQYFPFEQMRNNAKEVITVDKDIPSAWAKEFWEIAKKQGVTDGTRPQGSVTREETITMLYRALRAYGVFK